MPADSDKVSVSSSATTLSDKSSTETLVGHEALNGAATSEKKTDSAEKSGSNEPSTAAKSTFEKKPARAHVSSKGLDPFLYANWAWGGPACIDFPDAELRRERKKWEDEKKSSK